MEFTLEISLRYALEFNEFVEDQRLLTYFSDVKRTASNAFVCDNEEQFDDFIETIRSQCPELLTDCIID